MPIYQILLFLRDITMRKSDLIHKIATLQESLSASDITLSVQNILLYLTEALGKKGRIEIRGFGNLTLLYQKSRDARNPKTGEKLKTPGKYKVRFKMGKELKELLNPI